MNTSLKKTQMAAIRTVGELLKFQTLRTIRPEHTIEMCSTFMLSNDIARLPVVDEDGSLSGVISERDIRIALSIPYVHPTYLRQPKYIEKAQSIKVEDAMTPRPQVVSLEANSTIKEAIHLMNLRNIRGLPILEKSNVIGMLTHQNLLEHMLVLLSE